MPHSSGGGSHGGGFHGGGSHGGSSGPRISHTYFPGARRYRRHIISTGRDEYVYSTSMPQKQGIGPLVIVGIMAAVFMGALFPAVTTSVPTKLKAHYLDKPAVYDDIDVIKDDDALIKVLDEYQELTGICPVIYTTYNEKWDRNYDLEAYTFEKYTDNFKDEEHWVFVFSIPESEKECYSADKPYVPHYSWEAVQGDDTDPFVSESMFRHFGIKVQNELEKGSDPGVAFTDAFKYAISAAESKLKPGSPARLANIISTVAPFLFIGGFFVFIIVLLVKNYKKEKDCVYDEVPLDVDPQPVVQNGTYRSVNYNLGDSKTPKAAKVMSIIFLVPFIASGIGMLVFGIGMLINNIDKSAGTFVTIFGTAWLLISVVTLFSLIRTMTKASNANTVDELKESKPVNAGFETETYAATTKSPFVPSSMPEQAPSAQPAQTEFDPVFFNSSKSDYETDDEDYKRMKRQGFE